MGVVSYFLLWLVPKLPGFWRWEMRRKRLVCRTLEKDLNKAISMREGGRIRKKTVTFLPDVSRGVFWWLQSLEALKLKNSSLSNVSFSPMSFQTKDRRRWMTRTPFWLRTRSLQPRPLRLPVCRRRQRLWHRRRRRRRARRAWPRSRRMKISSRTSTTRLTRTLTRTLRRRPWRPRATPRRRPRSAGRLCPPTTTTTTAVTASTTARTNSSFWIRLRSWSRSDRRVAAAPGASTTTTTATGSWRPRLRRPRRTRSGGPTWKRRKNSSASRTTGSSPSRRTRMSRLSPTRRTTPSTAPRTRA